jgi:hypothetical protein
MKLDISDDERMKVKLNQAWQFMLSKPSNPSIRFHEPQCSSQESSLGSRHSVGPLCGGYRYPKSKGVFALFAHLNLSIS